VISEPGSPREDLKEEKSMEKVKWGVIGAGGIADRRTIPGLLQAPNCELLALMDVANNDALSAKYQVPCYGTEDELLHHPGIDAVYIATPVFLHLEQIRKAARAGKHVLAEKPLCLNSKQAEQAVAACREAGVLLQEGYMMRFHGAHQRIREIICDGEIGKPVYARAQLSCWYPRMEGAWRQEKAKSGGGALIDMATHLYDLLEMFIGPIVKVGAIVNTQVQEYPVDDSATTLLQFESGCHATVDTFYCIPDMASRTRLEIYGDQGSILTEGTVGQSSSGVLEVYRESSGKGYDAAQSKDVTPSFRTEEFDQVNPYTRECEVFAESVLAGRTAAEVNSGESGLHIIRVMEAAYASALTGRFTLV
jgi:predicted dehydrogenase